MFICVTSFTILQTVNFVFVSCMACPSLVWPIFFLFYLDTFQELWDENDKSMDLFTSKWFQIGFYEPILHTTIFIGILSIVALCGPFQFSASMFHFSFFMRNGLRLPLSLLSLTLPRSVSFHKTNFNNGSREWKKKKLILLTSYENFSI